MNLITVIPITRAKVAETLSYFTGSEVPNGAIVSVPLRSKTIHGIVVETRSVTDMKSEIKTAPYEIKRAGKVKANIFFPVEFMIVCKKLSEYYASNIGAVIRGVISDSLLESLNKIASPFAKKIKSVKNAADPVDQANAINATNPIKIPKKILVRKGGEIYAVQGDDEDRMSTWRSLIRQEFAKKKSIVFYVPTIENVEALFASLEKGIEDYIFFLHGNLTKKIITNTWQKISKVDHPIVVIATGTFSILPRTDIDTVIIERENDRGWIGQRAPYLDLRRALELISVNSGKTLFLADSMLRIETLHRLDANEIDTGSPMKWRSISNAKDILVDMVKRNMISNQTDSEENRIKKKGESFRIISPELERLIEINREDNAHLFIFAARRGMASMTVCDDCETIVNCFNCGSPVVLHASKESNRNFYLCHKCGEIISADITCKNCGGFRLTPLGIGIDRVEQEIRDKFQGIEIIRIDTDTTKTDKQVSHALEQFKERPGSVLLGTELALTRIREKVDHVAVASLDSLFALPDFRIPEKIMYMLVRLRQIASRSILVQTRKPEENVFEYGLKGNLSDFYRGTLDERKQFFYPPFATLIKISIEGKKDPIAVAMADIRKCIEPRELDIFPAFTSAVRGNSIIHGLLKISPNEWPDVSLVAKLRSLPPNVYVRVNPESLL